MPPTTSRTRPIAATRAVTSIGSVWQVLSDCAIRRRFAAPMFYAHCMTICMALLLLMAEWCVARVFNPLSWVIPLILGATAFLCYHVGRQFR